jgi:hypothetical protein
MHDSRNNHLDGQPLALICFASKDKRLSALAEVHTEVDSEAIAQLEEGPKLLAGDHQVVSKPVAIRGNVHRTQSL